MCECVWVLNHVVAATVGMIDFDGLVPETSTPFTVIIEAIDSSGIVLETIERRVRLGRCEKCI